VNCCSVIVILVKCTDSGKQNTDSRFVFVVCVVLSNMKPQGNTKCKFCWLDQYSSLTPSMIMHVHVLFVSVFKTGFTFKIG